MKRLLLILLLICLCAFIFSCGEETGPLNEGGASTASTNSTDGTASGDATDGDGEKTHVHLYRMKKITKEPTCTEFGEKIMACACGDEHVAEVMKRGHSYTVSRVAPTCTEKGYLESKCTGCGAIKQSNEEKPLGHNYGEADCIACGAPIPLLYDISEDKSYYIVALSREVPSTKMCLHLHPQAPPWMKR